MKLKPEMRIMLARKRIEGFRILVNQAVRPDSRQIVRMMLNKIDAELEEPKKGEK